MRRRNFFNVEPKAVLAAALLWKGRKRSIFLTTLQNHIVLDIFGMDVNLVFAFTFALGHKSLAKSLLVKSNLLDYYYLSFETSTYSKLD